MKGGETMTEAVRCKNLFMVLLLLALSNTAEYWPDLTRVESHRVSMLHSRSVRCVCSRNLNGLSLFKKNVLFFSRTGPAAQINFMGYAKGAQNGRGIHLRLRARAFIMAEDTSDQAMGGISNKANQIGVRRHRGTEAISSQTDPEKAVCFVSADIGMGSDLLTMKVVQRLEEILPKQQGGKRLCHLENLSIRYAFQIVSLPSTPS
jgi:hypothetical protein